MTVTVAAAGPSRHLVPSSGATTVTAQPHLSSLQSAVMAAGASAALLSVVTAPVYYSVAIGATVILLWKVQR